MVKQLIDDGELQGVSSVNELITVVPATGTITFKAKFFTIGSFNLSEDNGGKPLMLQAGIAYQWDILNPGGSNTSLGDDAPMLIVKDYTAPDGPIMESRSYGNIKWNKNNAVNGRFEFTITE